MALLVLTVLVAGFPRAPVLWSFAALAAQHRLGLRMKIGSE